jgi:hypothetical protein
MPLQKGKRRKRPRRRGPAVLAEDDQPQIVQERRTTRPATRRRGWQPPLAFNLIFGLVMIGLGLFFFVIPQKGMGTQGKLLLLILYFGLGALSLGRAYRQYRSKQQQ